jgi:Tol biopolymer transport system component
MKMLFALASVGFVFAVVAGSAGAGFPGGNGRVVFRDNVDIATANLDGTGEVVVARAANYPNALNGQLYNPAASADGSQIAFDDGNTIYVMNVDGSSVHLLRGGLTGATYPTWSPDSKKIAFAYLPTGSSAPSIAIVNADGTNFQIHLAPFELDSYDQPAWSPDGTRIAYRLVRLGAGGGHHIAVMPASGNVSGDSGSSWRFWTQAPAGSSDAAPNWSPDGTQLAFTRYNGVNKHILRVLGQGIAVDLTPSLVGFSEHPTWSPKGDLIMFDQGDLWTVNSAGGSPPTQANSLGFDMADWIPSALDNTPVSATPQTVVAGSATITFDSVTQAGTTSVTTSATGPAPPSGFEFGSPPIYYSVQTTALFGTAVVCITDSTITASSRLFHYANGAPPAVDVTAAGYPDAANHRICSTPLTSLSPFLIGQVPTDTTPPSLSVSHTANGLNGWNLTSPVAVTILASDASGLAGPPVCSDAVNAVTPKPLVVIGSGPFATTVTGEGSHSIVCTVSDAAHNPATATDTVNIDTQAPLVSYFGNQGIYTVDQVVNITCVVSDPSPSSGLASNTCTNITGPASSFAAGTNSFSATATDNAGNNGHGSAIFTVQVTVGSLCLLTKQYLQASPRYAALNSWQKATLTSLANAICQRLPSGIALLSPPQKTALLNAYGAALQALVTTGWLTQGQANTLRRLASAI